MKKRQLRRLSIFLLATVILAGAYAGTFSVLSRAQEPANGTETSTSTDSAQEPTNETEASASTDSAQQKSKKKTRKGWYNKKSKTYYYKKGTKVTGWCKIKKKYYYFDKKGVLQKNTIVGSKKKGYYYVDADGVRVTDSAITKAVSYVMRHSKKSQSSAQRLRSCFVALCGNPYQRIYSDQPYAGAIRSYALYMFNYGKGNCYRYASALAYIARVLGYDSRVAVGGVTSHAYSNLSPHGWCEVKVNGAWRLCDCSMQAAHWDKNLFLTTWGSYPFILRRDATYTMQVKKGNVSWG